MRKAQTFSSPGFVITQSFRIFRHKVFRYGKVTKTLGNNKARA